MPWSPLQLGNLVAYHTAQAGVTQAGGNVTAWADQSGNGHNVSVASGTDPVYSATGFGAGQPQIQFTTTTGIFNTANFTFATTTLSWFVLLNVPTSLQANDRIISVVVSGSDSTTPAMTLTDPGPPTWFSSANIGGSGNGYTVFNYGIPQLVGLILDGTRAHYYLNSSLEYLAPGTAFSSTIGANPCKFYFGQAVGSSNTFNLAYSIVTSGVMSSGDLANLVVWTDANWGTNFTPVTLPPTALLSV